MKKGDHMKAKKQYWRCIFWIALAALAIGYFLFWLISIVTTPSNPNNFIDSKGLSLVLAILIGIFYYGALWLMTLTYEIILFAHKQISKRKFFISLGILIAILLGVILFLLIQG